MTQQHRIAPLRAVSAAAVLACVAAGPAAGQIDVGRLTGMTARSIGPSGMSGRIAAIDLVEANPNVIYVGAATGGLWKTANGGVTWRPLMDSLPAASIGAVRVHQPNPDVVWVGTGERNRRNSAGVGTGVYKSLDGGRTWTALGLERTGAIEEILIDPRDANVVYVAALGNTWADTEDRGLYKTSDGGRTWNKILYVNQRTGAGDLVMDPSNPDHLLVGMWEHRRWPWFFTSGGGGSGLYTTYDGGATWMRLGPAEGLPQGDLGRIGMDFAPGDPDVVYALVEAKRSVLLRSDDGGDTWATVNRERNINGRPFYYGQVEVDPTNENHVWIVESPVNHSVDGGKKFETLLGFAEVHVDHHAFRVHPDGRFIVDGNDGGVYLSHDGGATWRFVENLPLAQFYHVAVDSATPYRVLGGLQDNGSWRGPGVTWHNGGIRYYDWEEVGFGDGFATFAVPGDSRYGFATSQNAGIVRFDTETGERKSIRPDGTMLRFNWNAAMATDPFDGGLYLGSQFVHQSMDLGDTWTTISPDLTTNDSTRQKYFESGGLSYDATGAEAHTTILTIAPSPVRQGVIWVGTDDGNVQVTRDGGATWTDVTRNIRGVPAGTWVPEIRASRFDAGTAFVVFDNHRRGDDRPYLVRTTDYGRSWASLVTAELDYFLHAIEQDPVKADLLYLGSEFGLYVSLDGGRRWHLWRHGVPRAPVRGLVVHPREHDLVIGTHGRAAYVLDDVRPLRALADDPDILRRRLHLFEVPPAIQYQEAQVHGIRFTGYDMFLGENRPYGALLTYWLGERNGSGGGGSDSAAAVPDSVRSTIQVFDSAGEIVRTFRGPAKAGVNRTAWDLQLDGPRRPPRPDTAGAGRGGAFGGGGGPSALPGGYTIRVIVGDDTSAAHPVAVRPDPRLSYTMADRQAKLDALRQVMRRQEVAFEAQDRVRRATAGINEVLERLRGTSDSGSPALRQAGDSLKQRLAKVQEEFSGPADVQGILRSPDALIPMLGQAYGQLASSWAAPTPNELARSATAATRLEQVLAVVNPALEAVAAYRERVLAAGVEVFERPETISTDWRP